MIVQQICKNNTKNDEYYTPEYAVRPLVKYLEPFRRIWCPFDKDESFFCKVLRDNGHEVVNTHIDNGENFFDLNVECEAIVSNPPYSRKNAVLKRLFDLDVPFAMLFGVVGIFESQTRYDLFSKNKFEVMYFNRRIKYMKDYEAKEVCVNPPYSSVYICHNILPKQIVFEKLK